MDSREFDGFVLVDWVRSAGRSVAVAGRRAGERHRSHRDKASAP